MTPCVPTWKESPDCLVEVRVACSLGEGAVQVTTTDVWPGLTLLEMSFGQTMVGAVTSIQNTTQYIYKLRINSYTYIGVQHNIGSGFFSSVFITKPSNLLHSGTLATGLKAKVLLFKIALLI